MRARANVRRRAPSIVARAIAAVPLSTSTVAGGHATPDAQGGGGIRVVGFRLDSMRKQRDGGKWERGIARTALKDVDRAMRDRRLKTSMTRYIERGV